jgi:hypothetical protein
MKKFFLIAAAAAMVLSSCSKNNVSDNTTKTNQIGFGVYAGRMSTKADATFIPKGQTWLPYGAKFGVYCYTTTGSFKDVSTTAKANYMANEEVTYAATDATDAKNSKTNQDKYTYDTKYWPKKVNGTYPLLLSFYAYYPFGTTAVKTIPNATYSGLGAFEYTVPDAVASQPDFMLSSVVADQTYDSNSGIVPLTFYHVLSQIRVTAKIDDQTNKNATVIITGIKFNNLKNHDTVTPSYDGSTTTFTWGTADGSQDYVINPPSAVTLTTTENDFTTNGNTILTVPQAFGDDATVEITYTIQGNGGGPAVTVTVPVALKDLSDLEQGKCTSFDFTISLFSTNPIKFTASVTDWINDPRSQTI